MKSKYKVGDNVRFFKSDSLFREGYKPMFKQEVFEVVAMSSRKHPTFRIKDEQGKIIRGKFYQEKLIKVNQRWNCVQEIWLLMHLLNFFSNKSLSSFGIVLLKQLNLEGQWEVSIYLISYLQCTKMLQKESSRFWTRNFQNCHNSTFWNLVFFLSLRITMKL